MVDGRDRRPLVRIGEPGWLPVTLVSRALSASRSIGQLIPVGGACTGVCTRVSEEWILTAHHVVGIPDLARRFRARFGFVEPEARVFEYELDRAGGYFYSADGIQGLPGNCYDLDYVFIRLKGPFPPEDPSSRPSCTTTAGPPIAGTRAWIPQWIDGCPLRIEIPDPEWLGAGTTMEFDSDYLYHRSSTDPGSSGSPIFDEGWNLIAVHTHGKLGNAPDSLHKDNNWGTRITRIVKDAHDRGFDFSQMPALRALLP